MVSSDLLLFLIGRGCWRRLGAGLGSRGSCSEAWLGSWAGWGFGGGKSNGRYKKNSYKHGAHLGAGGHGENHAQISAFGEEFATLVKRGSVPHIHISKKVSAFPPRHAPNEWDCYNFLVSLLGGSAGGFGLGETAHSRLRLGSARRAATHFSIRGDLLSFAVRFQTAEDCLYHNGCFLWLRAFVRVPVSTRRRRSSRRSTPRRRGRRRRGRTPRSPEPRRGGSRGVPFRTS